MKPEDSKELTQSALLLSAGRLILQRHFFEFTFSSPSVAFTDTRHHLFPE